MAGRPPSYKSRTIYTFSIESELLEKFRKVAEREGKPISHILQKLIAEYVEKHGGGNPCFKLDQFVEDEVVKAWPTLGHDPWRFDLSGFDDGELGEIRRQVYQWMKRIEAEEALRRYEKGRVSRGCF